MQSPSNSSDKFYSKLPIFRDFLGVSDEKNFYDVPEDWLVVVSDIKGIQRKGHSEPAAAAGSE